MRISLVIPSLNAVTLPRTLTAVAAQKRPPDEIIVVGRDEVGSLAPYPQVKFIDTGVAVCAAAARNLGIKAASGDVIAFLDADCIPEPDWLQQHENRQSAGECVVSGSVIVKHNNFWAQSDNVSMFHEYVPQHPSGYRDLLPTLNLCVRRTVIDEVGGMDESLPAAEDADWTIRMRRAGFRLYFEPAAVIRHAPIRTSWSDVVSHWRHTGYHAIRVRLRYRRELNTPGFALSSGWLRMLSPLIAARVTMGMYANPIFWRHWASLPVVYITKIIYCWGAAHAIDNGDAFQAPTDPFLASQ